MEEQKCPLKKNITLSPRRNNYTFLVIFQEGRNQEIVGSR
jgi:hypothetical protein